MGASWPPSTFAHRPADLRGVYTPVSIRPPTPEGFIGPDLPLRFKDKLNTPALPTRETNAARLCSTDGLAFSGHRSVPTDDPFGLAASHTNPESMNRLLVSLALTLILVAPPSDAAAQVVPSPYRYMEKGQEVSLFGGQLATDPGRFGFGPGDLTQLGARYSVALSNAFSLEGLASTMFGPRDVVNPNRLEGDRVIEEAEVRLISLEARLQFALTGRRTWHGLQPFVSAGAGVSFDTLGDQDEDFLLEERDRFTFGTRLTGSFGGGFRYAVTQRWMLRVDGGLFLYKLGYPIGWRDVTLGFEGVPEDEWLSAKSISVGLAWRF